MRLHILGVGGTFMGGIALLAKECGHQVSGSDINVYPPMSTLLKAQRIEWREGYDACHIDSNVDCVIVGNVIKRGNPALEYVLDNQIPYTSGPGWLADNVLRDRWVLAVSGTHGKTSTASMLAWIFERAGMAPGFLIGGVPENFGYSARMGKAPYFVIEADEYDCSFFDKRSKFIHYHPKTLIINNLEYDHADIFPDLSAIQQQFHFLIRTVPGNGRIIRESSDRNIDAVLNKGCWTEVQSFNSQGEGDWRAQLIQADGSVFDVIHQDECVGKVAWELLGHHNVSNALASIAAAHHANIKPETAIHALSTFKNVKRRLEIKGKVKDIVVYDDFAHHPTAIAATLAGLRAKIDKADRIIAVLEFGSYTMRAGIHKEKMKASLQYADRIVCKNTELDWGLKALMEELSQPAAVYDDVDGLVRQLVPALRAGDHVVIMSNTGFNRICEKLLTAIEKG